MAEDDSPKPAETKTKSSYGKRPLWQWILIYVVVGGVIYGLIYYLALSKGGYKAGGYTTTQNR